MRVFALMFLLAAAVPVTAQEDRGPAVDACVAALGFAWTTDNVVPKVIQDFSELEPPTVRMAIDLPDRDGTDGFVTCTFSNEGTRSSLTDLCILSGQIKVCLSEDARRLEEVQFLLKDAGH